MHLIRCLIKLNYFQSLKLLSVMAAIRLDDVTDSIEKTLTMGLLEGSPKKSSAVVDPLASSTWIEVHFYYCCFTFFHESIELCTHFCT